MVPKLRFVIAALMTGMLCMPCTSVSAKVKGTGADYPAALHGIWEGGVSKCKLPGNPDSDVRMGISAKELIDYEEWSEPVKVVQISNDPQAWRIVSKLHLDDGDVIEVADIFLISAEENARLTVVNRQKSKSYLRCRWAISGSLQLLVASHVAHLSYSWQTAFIVDDRSLSERI